MNERIEKYSPYLVGVIVSIVAGWIIFVGGYGVPPQMTAAGTLTFGVVVAGFAATQRSMLLGMIGSEVMKFAVNEGFHEDILRYLMDSIYAGIVLAGVSVLGILIFDCSTMWKIWSVSASCLVTLILSFMVRNEMIMSAFLKKFLDEQSPKKRKVDR